MKKYLIGAVIMFVVLVWSGLSFSATWAQMTYAQKKSAILSQAMKDYSPNGKYVGQNCKEWASFSVVYPIAGKPLQQTNPDPNNWYWVPQSNPSYVAFSPRAVAGPQSFIPGDIVQMSVNSTTPHTAIVVNVYSNNGGGIVWIESNWYHQSYPNWVFQRSQSFADFNAKYVVNGVKKYTVYDLW